MFLVGCYYVVLAVSVRAAEVRIAIFDFEAGCTSPCHMSDVFAVPFMLFIMCLMCYGEIWTRYACSIIRDGAVYCVPDFHEA